MEENRVSVGVSLEDLNDFQYLNSALVVDLFDLDFSLGLTGNIVDCCSTAIGTK